MKYDITYFFYEDAIYPTLRRSGIYVINPDVILEVNRMLTAPAGVSEDVVIKAAVKIGNDAGVAPAKVAELLLGIAEREVWISKEAERCPA